MQIGIGLTEKSTMPKHTCSLRNEICLKELRLTLSSFGHKAYPCAASLIIAKTCHKYCKLDKPEIEQYIAQSQNQGWFKIN